MKAKLTALMHLGAIDAGLDPMMDGDAYDRLIRDLARRYDDGRSIEEMQHDEANDCRRLD